MAKDIAKGLSHAGIKKAGEDAKAAKDAPERPNYRHYLSRLNVSSFGKNDDELPRIVKEQLTIIGEFFDAYPAERPELPAENAEASDGK